MKSVLMLLFSVAAMMAKPALAADVQTFSIGEAKVAAIQDLPSEMDASLFKGVDEAVVRKMIPDGKAPASVSVFLIVLDGRNILVDTGMGSGQSKLRDGLKNAGISPEKIDYVLLTHLHGDHVGGLAFEKKTAFPNAEIWVGRLEKEFWLDEKTAADPSLKDRAEFAKKNLGLYGDKVKTFDFGEMILPGLTALDASGHTPGHTAYMLDSGQEKILFWGDIVHGAALQFAYPEASAAYDMDMKEAVDMRRSLMVIAAEDNLPVAGAHLPFPSIGRVVRADNAFAFHPGL